MPAVLTFRSFFLGLPRYVATTPWRVYQAIPIAVLIWLTAQILAAFVFPTVTGIDVRDLPDFRPGGPNTGTISGPAAKAFVLLMLVAQTAIIGMTVVASLHGGPGRVLGLITPDGGWRAFIYAIVGMIPVLAAFNCFAFFAAPEDMTRDFEFFKGLARIDAIIPAALAIGAGASASEEAMFRGFLLSALAATRIGFWPAAITVTVAWTLLHWGYSWIGLLEVFVIGLYFSWLLWRTGSLWPALFCHALYNLSLLAALRYWPT